MPSFRRGSGAESLPDGLYEDLITEALSSELDALRRANATIESASLSADDVDVLVTLITEASRIALEALSGEGAVEKRVTLTREVLDALHRAAPKAFRPGEAVPTPTLLMSVMRPNVLGLEREPPPRPATSLARSELFTNSERQSVVQELASEIGSADRIDLLCAFIKWSGFLKFRDALARHCSQGRELRVLTTTYLGATEARAVEELQRLGAQVRISYEQTPTRLHAKAWMFHRRSGLSTAYIGSSNLSRAALTEGLEWNVRVAATELPRIVERFQAVFRSYWEDPDSGFVSFDGSEQHRQRLRDALHRARSAKGGSEVTPLHVLDVTPHDYQRRMLEDLAVARSHGRTRNLVVAATGTGKTVVAALDYARLRSAGNSSGVEKLLFVAHRDTILKQARETFRAALKDSTFGELWVSGERPQASRHVFASVQSIAAAMKRGQPFPPDAFDMVIVDEVHHAPADTYAKFLRALQPKILLGLTATPERMDDDPERATLHLDEFFDRPWASELRLWEAIDRQILVPFNYFAVNDGTDVRSAWQSNRYDLAKLSNVYTAGHVWLEHVARAVHSNVRDPAQMRALAFCVDVRHAELAAKLLGERLKLRVEAVTSALPVDRRAELLREFASNGDDRPRVLCVVDLLNEGVDIPPVDTLLLMRPTESATVFIQQLGRGLRRAYGKDSLTVLDFIGVQHEKFRFDVRYTALLGTTRGELHRALKANVFPRLPSGCSFQLEELPRDQVLKALRRSLGLNLKGLAERLDRDTDAGTGLEAFLEREQLELPVVYDEKRTWAEVRETRGFAVPGISSDAESAALREVQRLIHVDDPWRLEWLRAVASGEASSKLGDERERRLVRMLASLLLGFEEGTDEGRALESLRGMARLRWELEHLSETLAARSRVIARPPSRRIPEDVPLHLHGRYRTEEIAAAFDKRTRAGQLYAPQTGVVEAGDFDLLLVTLNKSAKSATPHLQYEDYAISPTLFHWESQASTRRDDRKGRRHLSREITPLLFVREVGKDDRGLGVPYHYLGVAERVDDKGERPIQITWRLVEAELPADLLQQSRAAVA